MDNARSDARFNPGNDLTERAFSAVIRRDNICAQSDVTESFAPACYILCVLYYIYYVVCSRSFVAYFRFSRIRSFVDAGADRRFRRFYG